MLPTVITMPRLIPVPRLIHSIYILVDENEINTDFVSNTTDADQTDNAYGDENNGVKEVDSPAEGDLATEEDAIKQGTIGVEDHISEVIPY